MKALVLITITALDYPTMQIAQADDQAAAPAANNGTDRGTDQGDEKVNVDSIKEKILGSRRQG